MRRTKVPQYVYFASACGKVKIGCSIRPEARVFVVGEWIPFPITMLATMPGDYAMEAALHAMFDPEWSHGEWFNESPRLLALIDRVARGLPIEIDTAIASRRSAATRAKKAASRRVTTAETRAGFPNHWPTRVKMRPDYINAALATFAGPHKPAPSQEALDAIAQYERELAEAKAA